MQFKEEALTILKHLNDNGYEAYIVGGAVRNMLLGIEIDDYDITTSATPDDIFKIFTFAKIFPTGLKHGTVTLFYNHTAFEITTFRSDGDYLDNRHPIQVQFTTNLNTDLARRDFTINAICYNKKIIDLYNGQEDLKNKIIRTVNDPYERFSEDALRILRALRFSAKFNFDIELKTKDAMHYHCFLLKNISVERIMIELQKTFINPIYNIVNEFYDIFEVIFPNISSKYEILEKCKYLDTLKIKNIENLKMFIFFKSIISTDKIKEYKLSKKMVKFFELLSKKLEINDDEIAIKYLLKEYDLEYLILYTYYYIEDSNIRNCIIATMKRCNNQCHNIKMLAINGYDLINLGFFKKKIKIILETILDLVINNKLENDTNILLNYVNNNFKNKECL